MKIIVSKFLIFTVIAESEEQKGEEQYEDLYVGCPEGTVVVSKGSCCCLHHRNEQGSIQQL